MSKISKGYKIVNQYGLHFLTFTVVGWVDLFNRKECKDIFIESLKYCKDHKGLQIWAFVIMPSHVHLIASASNSSDGLSAIIRDFKKFTSKELLKWVLNSNRESRRNWMLMVFKYHARFNHRNSKYQIWKQENRPQELIHPRFTCQKLDYIHINPVKDGIVDNPEDYRYSSARNYMQRNDYALKIDIIDFGFDTGYIAT